MHPPGPELDAATTRIAREYGKQTGLLTASGMAAIECALRWSGIGPRDWVVVPSECCHRVVAAVLAVGARPLLADAHADLCLSPVSLARALEALPRPHVPRALVAVHHLGLPCDVAGLRAVVGAEVLIIEDAAQAFGLEARGAPVGSHSDLVVTSFGATKPLSLNGGGGVFGSAEALAPSLPERDLPRLPCAAPLHPAAVAGLDAALVAARARVAARRAWVQARRPLLEALGLSSWRPAPGDVPSWHRLPLRGTAEAIHGAGLEGHVQSPHQLPLWELPMFADAALRPATRARHRLLRLDDLDGLDVALGLAERVA